MENPGEELVGSYLKFVLECDFVDYNPSTRDSQGEMDVIGINTAKKIVYICEVVTHLETGLQYVKDRRPDNVSRITNKFQRGIEYGSKYLKEFERHYMLWSPIVKSPKGDTLHNQRRDIDEISANIKQKFGIELDVFTNEKYLKAIESLRNVALSRTDELKTPIMRFLQIEEKLKAHVAKLNAG